MQSTTAMRAAFVAALCLITACGQPLASPAASPQASSGPTANPHLSPTSAFSLVVHEIPGHYTTPALAFDTDGTTLFWTRGAAIDSEQAADIWVFELGAAEPIIAFDNPRPDSSIYLVRGDGQGALAFVEQNERQFGLAASHLWYLSAPGKEPQLIDKGDVDGRPLPAIALTPDRLLWTDLHHTDRGVMSQLLELDLKTGARRVLQEVDANLSEVLFPSVSGDTVVYTRIDANEARTKLTSSTWMLDLSDRDVAAVQLSPQGSSAFMGVISGDTVVWQSPGLANPFNGGDHLVVHDLGSGEERSIDFGFGLVRAHSVGPRFVTAETDDVTRVSLYDLSTGDLREADATGTGNVPPREAIDVRPRLAGDLLVFVRASEILGSPLSLRWAELPH